METQGGRKEEIFRKSEKKKQNKRMWAAKQKTRPTKLLRGTIVNGTYGVRKNLPGIYLPIFTNNIWYYSGINYGPP